MSQSDPVVEIGKAVPPTVVAGLHIMGVSVPEVVQVLTAVYLLLLCIQMGYRGARWAADRWRRRR